MGGNTSSPHPRKPQNRVFAFPLQNPSNPSIAMGRTKGAKDLQLLKRGALIALKETSNLSNRELGDRYHCHEKTVRNTLKTASAAEKENIDPLSTQALQRRLESGRPYAITPRTQRALIRHATKNKV